MKRWCDELHSFLTDTRLHVPAVQGKPKQLIRKTTRLLVSHEDMLSLQTTCPGEPHGKHALIAGSHPAVRSISQHAGRYTPKFVSAISRPVPSLKTTEVLILNGELLCHQQWCQEILAAENEQVSDDVLQSLLTKLHKKLGHPSSDDFIRVLKHGQASDRALELARQFKCPQREASRKPSTPFPAQVSRVADFNQRVGLDVKHLPGWRENQNIKALNITDHASKFPTYGAVFRN